MFGAFINLKSYFYSHIKVCNFTAGIKLKNWTQKKGTLTFFPFDYNLNLVPQGLKTWLLTFLKQNQTENEFLLNSPNWHTLPYIEVYGSALSFMRTEVYT